LAWFSGSTVFAVPTVFANCGFPLLNGPPSSHSYVHVWLNRDVWVSLNELIDNE
jgi:hypothetical protein